MTNGNSTGSASVSGSALTINFPGASAAPVFRFYGSALNVGGGNSYVTPYGTSAPTTLTGISLQIAPQACTLGNLNVTGFSYVGGTADTLTATVYKNGSLTSTSGTGTGVAGTATGLSCQLAVPTAGTGQANRASCSSTGSSVALAAGDNFYIQITETGSTATSPYFRFAVTATCQ